MKFILDNWPLILAALTSGGLLMWPQLRGAGAGGNTVPTAEAVRLINREKAVLVDVSDAAEYAASHAGGARHIPLAELAGAKGLPGNKTTPVVLLCATGARSGKAAAQLRGLGYEKAVAVAGGLNAWRDAQLPVEKSAAAA